MTEAAALLATTLLVGLSLFQIALIFGAPIGHFAWGGKHRVLPLKLRVSSGISIIIYIFLILLALEGVGYIDIFSNDTVVSIALWISFAYLTLGIFLNAISRSRPERTLMTPMAALLAICFFLLAQ